MYKIINKNTGKAIRSKSKSFFTNIGHIKLMIGSVFKGKIKYTSIEVIEYELVEKSRKPLKEYL